MGVEEAAALLLRARSDGKLFEQVPETLRPADEQTAYAIQQEFAKGLGEIGGWKVGAPGPDAPAACSPMPASGIVPSPATLSSAIYKQREVESEIAFMIGEDLPSRELPYEAADVMAAIIGCHPAIEVLQSRFADPNGAGALPVLADLIQHGAFVWGDPIEDWQDIDFAAVTVRQTIEGAGEAPAEKSAVGNPAGDMVRLMVWLANDGARWAGGLKAGQIVTCGSWTGKTPAPAASKVTATFEGAEPVLLSFVE